MANKRMFATAIINSHRFVTMPATSRLLYYDLGMRADDDGVVEAFIVMRATGANDDDLKVLLTKGFLTCLDEEELVFYINDWHTNNLIRKDRYKPSIYRPLLNNLGIPTVDQLETEVSIVQENIVQEKSGKDTQGKIKESRRGEEGNQDFLVTKYRNAIEIGDEQNMKRFADCFAKNNNGEDIRNYL